MNLRVTKTFEFHMAHAIEGYRGACSHIHGHSYSLSVTVLGQVSGDGMVIDFKELKRIVNSSVIDVYDHSLLLEKTEKGAESYCILQPTWGNVRLVGFRPTTENILLDIAGRLQASLPGHVSLFSVRLCETGSSYAEWFSIDNPVV